MSFTNPGENYDKFLSPFDYFFKQKCIFLVFCLIDLGNMSLFEDRCMLQR